MADAEHRATSGVSIAWALPALFLAAVMVFAGGRLVSSPPPLRTDDQFRIDPAGGAQLGAWMNQSGGGLRFSGGQIRESIGVFQYAATVDAPDAVVVVELHAADAAGASDRRTRRFALRVTRGPAPAALLDAIEATLREHELDFTWIEAAPPESPSVATLFRVSDLKVPVAWFLLAQAPLWLALAYRRALRLLWKGSSRRARWALAGAAVAAAIARWCLAPLRLVMLYVGYQLTSNAITLQPIPRYGAGAPVLHHVLLRAFGADHRTILVAHSVLGVLLVPLVAALAQAIHGRVRAAIGAAYLWALVPAFIAHDDSEALSVPGLFFLTAGLVLAHDGLSRRRPLALVGATALTSFAMMCRPELPFVAVAAVIVVAAGTATESSRRERVWFALSCVVPSLLAAAVLTAPHAAHVLESAALLRARDSLPMSTGGLGISVLDWKLYPTLLVGLALASLVGFAGQGARVARNVGLLLVAAVDFAITRVDLDPANILRVQVPGALFVALAAASGIDVIASATEARLEGSRRRAAFAAGVAAMALSALGTIQACFRRTNEDEEESFVRAARAALPADNPVLVRLGYGDVEGGLSGSPTHLYFPDYLFSPPGAVRMARDVVEWERDPTAASAFFYLGVRCYTRERVDPALPSPPNQPLRRACREIVERWGDGTLVEWDAPSHGDPLETGYYGTDTRQPLHLALYRLRRR